MSEITKPLVLDSTMQSGFHSLNVHLETIAIMMGKNFTGSWIDVQNIVMQGKGAEAFPVGTQFTTEHSAYGNIIWDVVAHNYDKDENGDAVPSMTLLAHDRVCQLQFDNNEAFYYAETELHAGTYNITITGVGSWTAGTYQFTLANSVPAGGVITVGNSNGSQRSWDNGAFTTCYACTWASRESTTLIESKIFTSGNGGTSLGTTGVELNHVHRLGYGSNNYAQSAMRQFLNSDANAGSVWTPQTKFDRPPSWASLTAGFKQGLPEEFLAVVGKSKIANRANSTYESDGYTKNTKYFMEDEFWLPTMTEVGLGTEGTNDGTSCYAYFNGATNEDRIKTAIGGTSAGVWWLRSPDPSYANSVRDVNSSGALNFSIAYSSYGVCPACVIY